MLKLSDIVTEAAEDAAQRMAWDNYERSALELIDEQYLAVAARLSLTERQALVAQSHKNAKALGFVTGRDHLKYLSAVFFWGSFFTTDPQFYQALLRAGWLDAPGHRPSLTRLAHEIDLYADATGGDLASYSRFMDALAGIYRDADTQPALQTVCDSCARVWPHRAARLGPDGLAGFVAAAGKRAHGYGLAGPDLTLFCALALYFGYGFDCDPLYPWAVQAFAPSSGADQPDPEQWRRGMVSGVRAFFDARQTAKGTEAT
ncbi:hypothetical protein [Litoreibacter arenae]|uniref:Uncharacterized protein n=1 Tax=Litoreibacter arenae DSM 19593 TaxID=1123360 RepID=S9QFC1_9RHOB|nr:hypothetical protein [Litoreibacter arenae]EPX78582.1 hypothetical protein thalar_02374 [Litoreibacter arenae DSM 19593]